MANPISPEKFAEQMQEIRNRLQGDPERAHIEADNLMVEVLDQLGYGQDTKIFKSLDLWYA